ALAEARRLGADVQLAYIAHFAGWYFLEAGDAELAEALFDEAAALAALLGDRRLEPFGYRIRRALEAGDLERAEVTAREATSVLAANGKRWDEMGAAYALGQVLMARGRPAEALAAFASALRMAREIGREQAYGIYVLAACEAALEL